MFYPGQLVHIPADDEKRLGVYLGFGNEAKYPYKPYMYVFTLLGDNGDDSYTQIYNPDELRPLSKPDKKSKTGQITYKTSFQRPTFSRIFFDKEAEGMRGQFIEEMFKISKMKWFKDQYEIDTVLKKK